MFARLCAVVRDRERLGRKSREKQASQSASERENGVGYAVTKRVDPSDVCRSQTSAYNKQSLAIRAQIHQCTPTQRSLHFEYTDTESLSTDRSSVSSPSLCSGLLVRFTQARPTRAVPSARSWQTAILGRAASYSVEPRIFCRRAARPGRDSVALWILQKKHA